MSAVTHRGIALLAGAIVMLGCEAPSAPVGALGQAKAPPGLIAALREAPTAALVSFEGRRKRALAGPGVRELRTYRHLDLMLVELESPAALEALAADPEVIRFYEDVWHDPSLEKSLGIVGQPAALAEGKDGEGTTIAVLDTGLDYQVAAFGGCSFDAGNPSVPAGAGCRVAYTTDLAPSDGLRDGPSRHGTNVAAIAAGVAPGARVIALDVFQIVGGKERARSSDILAALDWVIEHRVEYGIVSVNMSFGSRSADGGPFAARCPGVYQEAIAELLAGDVVPVAASGNGAFASAMDAPACQPGVVSVGATYDDTFGFANWPGVPCSDATSNPSTVTCFSNSTEFLTLVAPGAVIHAGGEFQTGTSQASPHVAGAVAVIRGAFPAESAARAVSRMVVTGVPVIDMRVSPPRTTPRLHVGNAAADCFFSFTPERLVVGPGGGSFQVEVTGTPGVSCPWTVDSDAPWAVASGSGTGDGSVTVALPASATTRSATLTVGNQKLTVAQGPDAGGSLVVADGAELVPGREVTLTLSAPGATEMCLSESESCEHWQPFASSDDWMLEEPDGERGDALYPRTVRAWFRAGPGEPVWGPYADPVLMDLGDPGTGQVVAGTTTSGIVIAWSGFTDNVAVTRHRLVAGTSDPGSQCQGTLLYEGLATTFRHVGVATGVPIFYRVCAYDAAGRASSGALASVVASSPVRPPRPVALTPSCSAPTTPTFTWRGSAWAWGYELRVVDATGLSTTVDVSSLAAGCVLHTGCSFSPGLTLPEGNAAFSVRARNHAGFSGWSVPRTFVTGPGASCR